MQDPLPRLFAARCLLTAGERQGAEMLLQLAESASDGAAVLDHKSSEGLDDAVRALLAELSGTAADAGPEVWRGWLDGVQTLRPRVLDAPELAF